MPRIKIPTDTLAAACALSFVTGCASLHHYQLGEIDNRAGGLQAVDTKTSATGLNLEEAAELSKLVVRNKSFGKTADAASNVWKAVTYGPRTGEVTFSDDYADGIHAEITKVCPRGFTGLQMIRETAKYPIISGEIVRARGFCPRTTASRKEPEFP